MHIFFFNQEPEICSPRVVGAVFVGLFVVVMGLFFVISAFAEEPAGKHVELKEQLQQLEKEAETLDRHLQDVQGEKRTLANEMATIDIETKQREIEIKRLSLVVRETANEIKKRGESISVLSNRIDKGRRALASSLLLLYTYDQDNTLMMLLKNKNLSDFFTALHGIETVQGTVSTAIDDSREDRMALEKERAELEEFEEEQRQLRLLQEVERRTLAQKKKEKDELLRLTRGKETLFQQLLSSKKRDIASLKTQLFYLEKTGVTAEDAVRYAELAAKRTGIRTSFLLGLLEVETGRQFENGIITAGTNLGTGNWKADMNPKQYAAFLEITGKLNFDPDKMPVSTRPCSKATRERIGPGKPCGYGWGGAMGPAQFIPTTWNLFESRVAELTGHNPPNPWNIEDAFTAAALFLADAGATSQTEAGEIRAAKTYLSGKPSCRTSSCNAYARNVLRAARSISAVL